ncbi:ead/Ea22-like family protein [Enterobacter hormaechei]|uniref:ead/Ea22-like family protein n=1 Tax=Enterobacter hormaechei TaxID=158836 RepID=UPI0034CFEAF3
MSNIDKQTLRDIAAAAKSTPLWHAVGVFGEIVDPADQEWKPVHDFCKTFTAERVLALLDELEAKDNRINRLEAIVAVAEQRNALMREWKRELKVPCDLVDNQVPVVIHGIVIRLERLKETEEKLEAAEKRIAELEARAFNPAILDVIAERQRQKAVEGWTSEHDDEHCNGELAMAAVCYINETGTVNRNGGKPWGWPWDASWWKPNARRRNLVKAGALILAEIERIDRAAGIGKGE